MQHNNPLTHSHIPILFVKYPILDPMFLGARENHRFQNNFMDFTLNAFIEAGTKD